MFEIYESETLELEDKKIEEPCTSGNEVAENVNRGEKNDETNE
jgi:hypothetical protein